MSIDFFLSILGYYNHRRICKSGFCNSISKLQKYPYKVQGTIHDRFIKVSQNKRFSTISNIYHLVFLAAITIFIHLIVQEEVASTKWKSESIRISKKDRQHNGQHKFIFYLHDLLLVTPQKYGRHKEIVALYEILVSTDYRHVSNINMIFLFWNLDYIRMCNTQGLREKNL
jgi:hypothetical protein